MYKSLPESTIVAFSLSGILPHDAAFAQRGAAPDFADYWGSVTAKVIRPMFAVSGDCSRTRFLRLGIFRARAITGKARLGRLFALGWTEVYSRTALVLALLVAQEVARGPTKIWSPGVRGLHGGDEWQSIALHRDCVWPSEVSNTPARH